MQCLPKKLVNAIQLDYSDCCSAPIRNMLEDIGVDYSVIIDYDCEEYGMIDEIIWFDNEHTFSLLPGQWLVQFYGWYTILDEEEFHENFTRA